MFTKAFLALTGILYIGLSVWCSVAPGKTSGKVGFQLEPGSGQSEFLVVYGGLEMGLGLMFLMPLFRHDSLGHVLMACVMIHSSLVVYRAASFFMFNDIAPMTYKLAIGEWTILIVALLCMFGSTSKS